MKCPVLCFLLGVVGWSAQPTRVDVAYSFAQIGQRVQIRAAVYEANTGRPVPIGTMAYSIDGVTLPGCAAQWVYMVAGAAVCETSFPKVATYRVVMTYSGTGSYDPSSATVDIAVGKLYPRSYLAWLPPRPVYGGGLVVGALALGATGMPKPSGTFTFVENGSELATRTIGADDHAYLDLPLAAGAHTIAAVYNGDDLYQTSIPSSITFTIGKGTPTIAISSTPAQLRQPVMISASVLPEGAGGTITFTGVPGCAAVPLVNARASCGATFNSLGTVRVGAEYSGDSNLVAGTASIDLNVGRVVAGVYAAVSPAAPVYGQTVLVGALALGASGVAPPTGMVAFSDGAGSTGAAALNAEGRAEWRVTPAAGYRVFSATYLGDANYGTAQAVASVTVAKAATKTTLAASGGALTATVAAVAPGAGVPTGAVRFLRDGVAIGTAALSAGVATLDGAGQTGNLRAEYAGDLNFLPSVSAALGVSAPRVDLRITAANPAPAGPVALTVSAVPNPGAAVPTGTVQVTVDGAASASAALSAGAATVTLNLQAGAHAIAASYSGDAVYPAASASLVLSVTAPAGTIALTANPQSPVYGEPITFTAQLPPGASGTVRFTDGAVPLGDTEGVLTVSRLSAGSHAIAASWKDASAQLALTVAKARTATTLMVSGGVAAAQVVAVAPGSGTPAGAVRFSDAAAGTAFAAVPLESGTASAAVPAAVTLVAASYDGDANFAPSAAAPAGLLTVVNAASYAANSFAPGEIVTLFGPNLAGSASAKVNDSAGVSRGADLLYATAGQASLVLPEGLADGPATLTVAGLTAILPIARTAPGIFTADASGHGAPAGQSLIVHADGSQESGAAEAVDLGGAGDAAYLVLYGTGIRHFTDKVACTVGGRSAAVLFAGPQGGSAGVDQVNILMPAELKGIGRADVVVTADGVASNAVSVVFR